MPDLLTHLASGYAFALPFGSAREARVVFLAGTVLPDVLTRPVKFVAPSLADAFVPLHTPVGFLLFSGLAALAFAPSRRWLAFGLLAGGGGLHFLLDALQSHVIDEYHWLFPFSWWSPHAGLFWPEDSLAVVPWAVLWIVGVEWGMWRRRKASPN